MQSLNLDRVVASLKERGVGVSVTVTDFKPVTSSLARIIISASSNVDSVGKYELTQAIAKATGNNGFPVRSSFYKVPSNGMPSFVGFVRANTQSKPYVQSEVSKMRVMAKNMLMDASDDSLWAVKSNDAGDRMLVRQAQDDLSTLLASVQQPVTRAPKLRQLSAMANLGDAVTYVDPRREIVRRGFVASITAGDDGDALEIVQMPEENNPDEPQGISEVVDLQNEAYSSVTVPSSLVIAAVSMPNRFFSKEVAAPANANNKQALKDYYKKVWNQGNPEFLKKLFENIDRMAAA